MIELPIAIARSIRIFMALLVRSMLVEVVAEAHVGSMRIAAQEKAVARSLNVRYLQFR